MSFTNKCNLHNKYKILLCSFYGNKVFQNKQITFQGSLLLCCFSKDSYNYTYDSYSLFSPQLTSDFCLKLPFSLKTWCTKLHFFNAFRTLFTLLLLYSDASFICLSFLLYYFLCQYDQCQIYSDMFSSVQFKSIKFNTLLMYNYCMLESTVLM